MAGKALKLRLLAFIQVYHRRTGKSFENRHKPYANRRFSPKRAETKFLNCVSPTSYSSLDNSQSSTSSEPRQVWFRFVFFEADFTLFL